jgi:transposase-like protein
VAAVALSHRINANLVRRWIVRHRKGRLVREPSATLLLVTLSAPSARTDVVPPRARLAGAGVIEIELEAGRVRVRGAVDALGDVLADPAHRGTEVGAIARRLMHVLLARQVPGQCPANGLRLLVQ